MAGNACFAGVHGTAIFSGDEQRRLDVCGAASNNFSPPLPHTHLTALAHAAAAAAIFARLFFLGTLESARVTVFFGRGKYVVSPCRSARAACLLRGGIGRGTSMYGIRIIKKPRAEALSTWNHHGDGTAYGDFVVSGGRTMDANRAWASCAGKNKPKRRHAQLSKAWHQPAAENSEEIAAVEESI